MGDGMDPHTEPEVSSDQVDFGNLPPPPPAPPPPFLHALVGNQVEIGEHTTDLIEGWVQRAELVAERMGEAASRMEEAASSMNHAVTRQRTGD